MRVLRGVLILTGVCAASLAALGVACGGGGSDAGDVDQAAPTAAAVPTTPPPDADYVFTNGILSINDVPTSWDLITAPDSEALQRYGPEVCGQIGAERWSQAVSFFVGAQNDPRFPVVTNRVYVYAPGAASGVLQNARDCIAAGTVVGLPLTELGEESLATQIMREEPDGRVFVSTAIVRRGDFITLVYYEQYDDPARGSQLELFAVEADKNLESAMRRAPAAR